MSKWESMSKELLSIARGATMRLPGNVLGKSKMLKLIGSLWIILLVRKDKPIKQKEILGRLWSKGMLKLLVKYLDKPVIGRIVWKRLGIAILNF